MKTQITYPKHPILMKIIQYFIFIKKEDHDLISQICYPNTNHCLSLMKGSSLLTTNNHNYKVIPSENNNSYVTGIYKTPITISSNIPYQEVCINFNPLGLETVFNENISSYEFKNNILDSINYIDRNTLYEIVFSKNNIEEVQEEIETFFLNLIKDEFEIKRVQEINSINHFTNIIEIEDLLCKSYRSTHRYFTKQLDISPKEFLLIKKVREAMNGLIENKSISEIAYNLNFTDAAHFIKTFKKYTHQTPSYFKKKASILNNTLIWNLE